MSTGPLVRGQGMIIAWQNQGESSLKISTPFIYLLGYIGQFKHTKLLFYIGVEPWFLRPEPFSILKSKSMPQPLMPKETEADWFL